jgi:Putative MetA-pathway of phenol degradation
VPILKAAALLLVAFAAGSARPVEASDDGSPDAPLTDICTDRPTKSNYACTVDQDHFQYEADLINGSVSRADGVTTDTWLAPNPTVKYGISSTTDVELNLAPLVIAHTDDRGVSSTLAGIGDLYLRVKYRFIGNNDSMWSAALIPYVKLPTARAGIGNGTVEEGIIVPVNYKLTEAITLTTVPESDCLLDASGNGRHLNLADTLNVAYSINKSTVLYVELWGDWNRDPSGVANQFSADIALTYGFTNLLQIDGGVNAGLNRATPALQGYLGLSQKF